MERRGFNQADVARDFQWSEAYVSRVLSGHRRPGREVALFIEEKTGIPVSSWSDRALTKAGKASADKRGKARIAKALSSHA